MRMRKWMLTNVLLAVVAMETSCYQMRRSGSAGPFSLPKAVRKRSNASPEKMLTYYVWNARADQEAEVTTASVPAQLLSTGSTPKAQWSPGFTPTGGEFKQPLENLRFKSVLGQDTRVQIVAKEKPFPFPYRAIGHISSGCTGALIGTKFVLTAAHCVANKQNKSWYEADFTAAWNLGQAPYGRIAAKTVFVPAPYLDNKDWNYDFALIVLTNDIGLETGWFGFGYNRADTQLTLNTAGYPVDKIYGTLWATSCITQVQYTTATQRKALHTCDMAEGQSGSPMWSYQDKVRTIRAIHTNGVMPQTPEDKESGKPADDHNKATIIDGEAFALLKMWMTAAK